MGFMARIAIGYEYIGPYFLLRLTPPSSFSREAKTATVATDLLLIAGIGLLLGRNMRLLRKYLAIRSGKDQIESSNDEESPNSVPS